MLNEKEIIKWKKWLTSEQRRLERKGYNKMPQYKINNSKLLMLDNILNNDKIAEE